MLAATLLFLRLMKLEYLNDISDAGKYPDADPDKLIRLFSFDREEVEKLVSINQFWIINKKEAVELSTIPFIQPLNCTLTFEISSKDIGIDHSLENKFVCRLSVEGYQKIIDVIKPFADENRLNGYNWLYDPQNGKIDLLFSSDGTW